MDEGFPDDRVGRHAVRRAPCAEASTASAETSTASAEPGERLG
ncbi:MULTISPECIES: hypothetical protein [unclassified Streptomyces]|nr:MULTISPECIES: hypothetical protein [unclassified Streptomyces]MCX5047383.1 hypothetical protein [Streptomyces sp. NBC_00474]MCX5057921.1 hypothetical protein [Streptomyces sp. NBC_00452]MCX5245202.1 hypothetical protein [Streptomyces sp. NBC_00201]MCX5289068.1 hypothetical protein [Streptomyces sp. NBC_00183]